MGLIPVEEAQERIFSTLSPLPEEQTELDATVDRALARPIHASRTLPPWDNSAMDGYALHSTSVTSAGAVLAVSQRIFAGDRPGPLRPGTCARIMTGAPLPEGADAVIMQERATVLDDGAVRFDEPARAGQNVRKRGEDVTAGALQFQAGRVLSLSDLGALYGQGLLTAPVYRRPTVGVISSGDELADPGSTDDSRIIDSNAPITALAVGRAGGIPHRLGRATDTLDSHRAHFAKGLELDVLVTLAGASVGERDFTREALQSLGVEIDFWKVAMKPGKPLAFGRRDKTLVFGLPGNPVSAMVTFELFVRPALRLLQGLPALAPTITARLGAPVSKAPGLRHFIRARLGPDGVARPQASQSSGALSSAAGANCLIDLPTDCGNVAEGAEIRVIPLSWGG